MKKIVPALLLSAVAMAPQLAAAHTGPYIAPAAPIVFSGTLNVQKGLTLTCATTITISGPNNAGDGVAASHTDLANATVTVALSGGLLNACNGISVPAISGSALSYNAAAGTLTINGFEADTPTPGGCRGNLVLGWDGAGLDFDNLTIAPKTGLINCRLNGYIPLVSPASATINP